MASEVHPANEEEQRQQRIATRAELLWKLTEACEAAFSKYLLLSTAGGAVATLSFMGTAPELRRMWGPRIALVAFMVGVVMCGAVLAARARTTSRTYVRFVEDVAKFRKADISWDELASRCSPKYGTKLNTALEVITFVCLIVGAAAGVFTVWTRQ